MADARQDPIMSFIHGMLYFGAGIGLSMLFMKGYWVAALSGDPVSIVILTCLILSCGIGGLFYKKKKELK